MTAAAVHVRRVKDFHMAPGVIYVDARVGSKEFLEKIRQRHRLRVTLDDLPAADFAFRCGHTRPNPFCAGDRGCSIGIERKTLSDLIGSLLKNRLGKQVPDMIDLYTMSWLLIEGIWRPAGDDAIEVFYGGSWVQSRSPLTYSQLSSWLLRYDVMAKGRLCRWRTANPTETTAFIASTWSWWQKEWHKHQAQVVEKMPAPTKALMFRPTNLHMTAASLPEIGIVHCKKAYRAFGSIHEMMNAEVEDWIAAGFGKKDAVTIYNTIRKRYKL